MIQRLLELIDRRKAEDALHLSTAIGVARSWGRLKNAEEIRDDWIERAEIRREVQHPRTREERIVAAKAGGLTVVSG